MIPRETIYLALFALVTPLRAPGAVDGRPDGNGDAKAGTPTADKPFNLVSRKVIEVQRVPPSLQPVLFMDEAFEEFIREGTGLVKRKWTVYFHVGATAQIGTASQTILNPLLDTLEAAVTPTDPDDSHKLGLEGPNNIIESAQFNGLAIKNLGGNSTDPNCGQAVCYVPYEIIFAR